MYACLLYRVLPYMYPRKCIRRPHTASRSYTLLFPVSGNAVSYRTIFASVRYGTQSYYKALYNSLDYEWSQRHSRAATFDAEAEPILAVTTRAASTYAS